MTIQMRSRQRGLSLLGLLFVGGLLAVTGLIAAQVLPTAIEYQAIVKAVNKAAQGDSIAEVRNIFDKATAVDDITSITAKDIAVVKDGDKFTVSFSYQREIHLTGPAFLTLKYSGQSK